VEGQQTVADRMPGKGRQSLFCGTSVLGTDPHLSCINRHSTPFIPYKLAVWRHLYRSIISPSREKHLEILLDSDVMQCAKTRNKYSMTWTPSSFRLILSSNWGPSLMVTPRSAECSEVKPHGEVRKQEPRFRPPHERLIQRVWMQASVCTCNLASRLLTLKINGW